MWKRDIQEQCVISRDAGNQKPDYLLIKVLYKVLKEYLIEKKPAEAGFNFSSAFLSLIVFVATCNAQPQQADAEQAQGQRLWYALCFQ